MIPRPQYTEKIMPFANAPFVKILAGVRRSGKSTVLKMIMNELSGRDNINTLEEDSELRLTIMSGIATG